MKNSRRSFLKNSTLALVGAGLLPKVLQAATLAPPKEISLIGIQLYSVRTDMYKQPLETLKALADMGYKYVEHANYVNRKFYGYTATEFKKVLSDLGLSMPSGHTVMTAAHFDKSKNDFTDAWKYTVDDAATMGQEFVISPWMDENLRRNYDGLMYQLSIFNKAGELCKKQGMKFGYHNHDFEFTEKIEGKPLYDLIINNTDPNLVIQQLDFGNMYGSGGRAKEWIDKYHGRFPSLHVKDEIKSTGKGEMNDGYDSTTMGNGVVDPKGLCLLAKQVSGARHYIIEQESYQDKTPLECAKINLEIMKTWGLV
jgi:sugar phosphate isomerase/epimerase